MKNLILVVLVLLMIGCGGGDHPSQLEKNLWDCNNNLETETEDENFKTSWWRDQLNLDKINKCFSGSAINLLIVDQDMDDIEGVNIENEKYPTEP